MSARCLDFISLVACSINSIQSGREINANFLKIITISRNQKKERKRKKKKRKSKLKKCKLNKKEFWLRRVKMRIYSLQNSLCTLPEQSCNN